MVFYSCKLSSIYIPVAYPIPEARIPTLRSPQYSNSLYSVICPSFSETQMVWLLHDQPSIAHGDESYPCLDAEYCTFLENTRLS